MNIKKTIIIVIISVIISVSLSLLGVKIYNSVNHKKYTNSTSNKEKVYKDNKIKWVIEDDVDLEEAKNLRRYNETYKKKN